MESIGEFEYSKKDLIGHGAFAVVFKGRYKKKPDSPVAIKCITKKNLAKSQNLLSKEIKILKELSDLHHENVVALLDCKETANHVYLVMEYCNGGDLADYLQAKGTLSEDTIARFLKQIAGAMVALNNKGIVHRDLKPQNILLCHASGGKPNPSPNDIKLKIADFGFARFLQDGVMAATLCGSPMYMAPEVIMSLQYDAKADLWSVGTIVYQCLTGKAPFQAQTPQQLKQFYERNAALQPNIPSGTSQELKDLLMSLLKRNAKDRIEFDEFFNHSFLQLHAPPTPKSSSPVPVPRSRSRSSTSSESPPLKSVSASPLSGHMPMSPSNPALQRVKETVEPMEQGSTHELTGYLKARDETSPRCASPTDDYVMVPENIPSDHSAMSSQSQSSSSRRHPSSVDLNAIFSDPPESPVKQRGQSSSPQRKRHDDSQPESPQTPSPSRPSSLPVITPGAPTQPIPVPSQVKAYEEMQRSGLSSPNLGSLQRDKTHISPGVSPQHIPINRESSQGVPIPPRRNSTSSTGAPSVGSMSPPTVQFTIGTPPNCTAWKQPSQGRTPPTVRATPPSSSPLRRSGQTSPWISPPTFTGPTSLPPIVGSPTKVTTGFEFVVDPKKDPSPTSIPLQTPFGAHMRTQTYPDNIQAAAQTVQPQRTYPDNIAAVGFHLGQTQTDAGNNSVVPLMRCATEPNALFERSSSNSRLSEQLLRAAFGTVPTSPSNNSNFPVQSPTGNMVVAYGGSRTSLHREPQDPSYNRERSGSLKDRCGSYEREKPYSRRPSSMEDDLTHSPRGMHYVHSSPSMEGPISFVGPELAEETLMDKEHNETVGKLNFILALVECIIELAQSRSSPITESVDQRHGNSFKLDHVSFISESERQMEQLVLHVRALQLLSSSIELAREQLKSGRLQTSNSVKTILKEMNNYYHQCLQICKHLHLKGAGSHSDVNAAIAAVTADRLIYSYAIEMCQTAALDELFGNPAECFRRYRSAQILLHSLAQQAHSPRDRDLLNKYRESVEKRLYNLSSQGFVNAYESS